MPRVVPSQVVKLIETFYPQVKDSKTVEFTLDRSQRYQCVSIANSINQIPTELLTPPIETEYIELMSNIAVLNHTLDSWKTPFTGHVDNLHGGGHGNPITIIYHILKKCPDEVISTSASGLEFIDDDGFRDSLRMDLTTVSSALFNGEWKAATILAGSVSEALLLWAIKKEVPTQQIDIEKAMKTHGIKEKDFNNWILDWYNKVAKEIAIISEKTFNQINLAREFRNYIHPGREVREKTKCNIGTAHAGKAAVELLIEDLIKKYSTR